MLALCLAREDAVKEWRKILGPKEVDIAAQEAPESYVKSSPLTLQTLYIQSDFFCSLRAQFALEGVEVNALHGSQSVEDATKEVEYFFPKEKTVAVIKPTAISEKGI